MSWFARSIYLDRPDFFVTSFNICWCLEPQGVLALSPMVPAPLQRGPLGRPRLSQACCLPACWAGGEAGPWALQSPCPLGHGWPARAAPLHCEKGWGSSDKALGPPPHHHHHRRLYRLPVPPQPCTEAGVLHRMNFTTRSLCFHYEFPDPGQHPRPLGPPLFLSSQEASLPTQAAALKKDLPGSKLNPGVRGQAGS